MRGKYVVLVWKYKENEFGTIFSADSFGEFRDLEDAEKIYNSIELDDFATQKEIWLETEEDQTRIKYEYYLD